MHQAERVAKPAESFRTGRFFRVWRLNGEPRDMIGAGIPPTLAGSPDHGYTAHIAQGLVADGVQRLWSGFMEERRGVRT